MATTPGWTYSGSSVSAAFVTGMFNDSWDVATRQSALIGSVAGGAVRAANRAVQDVGVSTGPIAKRPGSHMAPVFDPAFNRNLTPKFNDAQATNADEAADKLRERLQGQLTDMLQTFIQDFFPFYQIPDGSDTWERVAATFDNQKLEGGIELVRQRISGAWAERGIAIPVAALSAQRRSVEKAADDAMAQNPRAQELIRLRELKGMDLIRFEQVNRQQTEALEAARAFLLSTLLPMSRKVSEDQDRITNYKRQSMDAYYRYLDTLLAADEAELARLVQGRSMAIDDQIITDQRKLNVFKNQVAVLEAEMNTIAQRASAALARLGVVVAFKGSEQIE